MKNLKFLLAFIIAAVLFSCLDTEEKIVLNDDNPTTYSMTLAIGRMLSMAASIEGDKANPEKVKEKTETILYVKDMVKAIEKLTSEEKAIFQNGVLSIKMDEAQN